MKSGEAMARGSAVDHHCASDANVKKALQKLSTQKSAGDFGLMMEGGDIRGGDDAAAVHGDLDRNGPADVAVDSPGFEGLGDSNREKFSIRDYVFTVRSSDIRKNWPFSQRYLKICLENGKKPLLPPFEPSYSVRDLIQEEFKLEAAGHEDDTEGNNVSSEDTSSCEIEERLEEWKHADNGFCIQGELQMGHAGNRKMGSEKSTECDSASSADQPGAALLREDAKMSGNGIEGILDENKAEVVGELAETGGHMVAENEGSRNSSPNMGTIEETEDRELRTEHRKKDSNTDSQQLSEPADEGHRITWANAEQVCKPQCKQTELPEMSLDVNSGLTACKKQANKMLTSEMKSQEEVYRCQKDIRKQEQAVEQNKAEAGRSEDYVNSGSMPDAMILKVCPVCRTFSSTSNTALNAHIDHCLAVEPSVEKPVTKFTKHKIKARKKRSMVEICAVAPTRTLEDLEHSTAEQLALDANPLQLDDLKWRDSKIRRQPRTPLSRGPKTQMGHADTKGEKQRTSSSLKMQYRPNLNNQIQHRDRPVSEDKDDESRVVKRSKQSASNNSTGTAQNLESGSFNNFNYKVPTIPPAKHILYDEMVHGKPHCASQETLVEEPSGRSAGMPVWSCINKRGSSKTKKFKHKMVNLKLAGIERSYCNHADGAPVDKEKFKDKNHVECSTLPERPIVESQASPGRFIAPQTEKDNDLSRTMPTKRNNTKQTTKISGSNCSHSAEAGEISTSKRTKHFSSLNLLNKKMLTASRDRTSICETKSTSLGKAQGEEEASFWGYASTEEKHQSLANSDDISGNDELNSQRSESFGASRILENGQGTSRHEKRSSVHCQLPRVRSKEQNKHLVNLSTGKRSNPFQTDSGFPSKKFSQFGRQTQTSCSSEYYDGERRQAKHFKYSLSAQKMKKVAHIVHDLTTVKEVAKIDVGKTLHISESSRKSPRFIYDAASTSDRADTAKHRDYVSTNEQLIFQSEVSVTDKEPRPSENLSTKHLKLLTSAKIDHSELPGETQTQLDSTMSTICQPSQMSCVSAMVGIDEYAQNCPLSNVTALLMSVSSGSLGDLSNKQSYEHDASILGMGNPSKGRLSPHLAKGPSEFYGASQDHLNSCSSAELVDVYSDDTLGKKAGLERYLGTQFTSVTDVLKEEALSMTLPKQTLRHKSSNQAEIFCSNSMSLSNKISMSDSRDPITTAAANISAPSNKSLYSRSIIQHLKSHWGSAVPEGALVLNSDRIGVAPVLSDTNVSDKARLSSEMITVSAGMSMPGLGKSNDRLHAMPQMFGDLAGTVFDHSIPSSPTSSIGLPLTSQGGLRQEKAMLLQDPQLVGSKQSPFGTSMKLTSVTVPQVVSTSLLAGSSGEMSTAGEVLHGSILNLSPSNPQTNKNVIQKSSGNISGWLFEKQNGPNKILSNSAFGVMDGMNGSCTNNNVHGSSPQLSNAQHHITTSTSCNGLKWHQAVSRNKFSGSDVVSSSGLVTTPEQSDFPQRFPALGGHVDCSSEPSVVHIFGNPILRLMGQNVMVSSKDSIQSRQVENGVTNSSERHTNGNCLGPLEITSEARFKQKGHSHLACSLENSGTLGKNTLQHFKGEGRRDSGAFWHSDDSRHQHTTAPLNLSEAPVRNSAGLASPSLTGTSLTSTEQSLRSAGKRPLSYVSPGLMDHVIIHGPLHVVHQVKWQSSSAILPQSDPEVIIIDDNIGTEATSKEAAFVPAFSHGGARGLQEGFSISTHSKLNSKVGSGIKFV